MNIPSEKELMKAGLHFGHKPENWHPQMANFIYGQKNGVHIIDLIKARQKLSEALEFVKKVASEGGKILFVGTKIQAKEIVKKYALLVNMPYVEEKWLGGTITNFKVINGLVKKMENLENQANKEDYEKKYTKKERLEFSLEIEHLKIGVEGIRNLTSLPQAIFLTSAKHEKTALLEAKKKHIPVVAVCDTNANPYDVDYAIPGNDDAIKSIELVAALVAEAIKEGTIKK
ncbi:MAG TPA: 30S ribosomal protein S2 [bacterium]|nr:30S ribosomal protein S2 [bacterium]